VLTSHELYGNACGAIVSCAAAAVVVLSRSRLEYVTVGDHLCSKLR
jgi:hypothetical protein